MTTFRTAFRLAACALPLALASCSMHGPTEPLPETGTVLEGTVTYNGKPVPMALVMVQATPPMSGSAQAFADDSGHFRVENVPIGKVQVGVNTEATKGQMMSRAMAGTDPNAKATGGNKAKMPAMVEVPKKYHATDTAGIDTTTAKGENKFDIQLK